MSRVGSVATVQVGVTPSYPVAIGSGILSRVPQWIAESRIALVCDETVNHHYGAAVHDALESAGKTVELYTVPPGEDSKSIAHFEALVRAFARSGLDRGIAVVALGGGVVSDLAGFVAASYMRGVAFYVVPTTVLAMVDASVGGKTAIDLPEGKNLVGAFWQPRAVLADVQTLRTLPVREFRLGAVEAYKHGLLADRELLSILTDPEFGPHGDADVLTERIERSVRVKSDVVAADERESGVRAHLNLGHTLGHALEAVSAHRLAHGDAVAYGLLFASLLGRNRGWEDWVDRAVALLSWLEPGPLPHVTFDDLAPYIARDKKNRSGRVRFVLLERVGRPVVVDDVTVDEQQRAWSMLESTLESMLESMMGEPDEPTVGDEP